MLMVSLPCDMAQEKVTQERTATLASCGGSWYGLLKSCGPDDLVGYHAVTDSTSGFSWGIICTGSQKMS